MAWFERRAKKVCNKAPKKRKNNRFCFKKGFILSFEMFVGFVFPSIEKSSKKLLRLIQG
jgi:hypothetical protein